MFSNFLVLLLTSLRFACLRTQMNLFVSLCLSTTAPLLLSFAFKNIVNCTKLCPYSLPRFLLCFLFPGHALWFLYAMRHCRCILQNKLRTFLAPFCSLPILLLDRDKEWFSAIHARCLWRPVCAAWSFMAYDAYRSAPRHGLCSQIGTHA